MDIEKDEFTLVDLEYLCFIISSKTDKNNDVNPKYPYNEPIFPTNETGLPESGHVKCNRLISIVDKDDIIMKVGTVTQAQYDRFIELFDKAQST